MEFKKYEGIGEYIFVIRDKDKWVRWTETYRSYHAMIKIFNDYDDYVKELLFNKLKEMNNEYNV